MRRFDLIILGGGAAGFAAAIKSDELQAKTLMVNNNVIGIGGTCVNVGCIPTKHLLYIGELIHKAKENDIKGLSISASFDFNAIIEEKNELIKKLREEKYEEVLKGLPNVEFVEGNAKFISKSEIQVNGETYVADKFIIATGSSTFIPSIEGIEKVDYLTNIEALNLRELPNSMVILGGGPLGVEFAQIFSRFGTKVYLLQKDDRIVPREEPELARLLQRYLQDEGIEVYTNVKVKKVKKEGKEKIVNTVIDGKEKDFKEEQILIASGRRANTSNLGLEKLEVKLGSKRNVIVNEEMQAARNVWAAGDVTGEPMLETIAAREGMVAANNALSENKIKMDYRVVPHAIFTYPQLAGVGLTDEQAIKMGIRCRCNIIPMKLVPKARAIKNTKGAIKVVIDATTQEIIGIHILAYEAADLIHEGVMIVKNHMKVDDVINTLHVFPTLSEAIKIAVQSFKRDVSKMSCCVE
jgi:mercuric reductase